VDDPETQAFKDVPSRHTKITPFILVINLLYFPTVRREIIRLREREQDLYRRKYSDNDGLKHFRKTNTETNGLKYIQEH